MTREQAVEILYKQRLPAHPRDTWGGFSPDQLRKRCEEAVDELIALGVLASPDSSVKFQETTPDGGIIRLEYHEGRYALWYHGRKVWSCGERGI